MAYSEQVIRRARERLAQAKQEAEEESARRLEEIYARSPRLREIENGIRSAMARVLAASFASGRDPAAAIEAAKQENLELQHQRDWILQSLDLDEADLTPQPVCAVCGGSGYVGERMCECLRELCRQEQKRELSSLLATRETFEAFRLDYYPEEPDPTFGVSPRRLMEKVYRRCVRYAREFSPESPSLLLTGGPGLGKTFLSACIARSVAEAGYSVVYDTAGKLFSDFEAAKFAAGDGENQNRTRKYLACDLLIVDDLGTEMTTQFTQSALYQVVNTRLMDRLPTLISTNLDPTALQSRYLPQITSRLLGTYETLQFLGRDIRMMKK